jgi:hypothetical protein
MEDPYFEQETAPGGPPDFTTKHVISATEHFKMGENASISNATAPLARTRRICRRFHKIVPFF